MLFPQGEKGMVRSKSLKTKAKFMVTVGNMMRYELESDFGASILEVFQEGWRLLQIQQLKFLRKKKQQGDLNSPGDLLVRPKMIDQTSRVIDQTIRVIDRTIRGVRYITRLIIGMASNPIYDSWDWYIYLPLFTFCS